MAKSSAKPSAPPRAPAKPSSRSATKQRSLATSIRQYHATLAELRGHGATHEGATERAFGQLLSDAARPHKWTLIPKQSMRVGGRLIVPDGTLQDEFRLPRGYWEAKDEADDLDDEISKKIDKKYPLTNTIFEDNDRAVLFQGGKEAARFNLSTAGPVADLLTTFFGYTEPDVIGFEQAVQEFKERVPELGKGLAALIAQSHKRNPRFKEAFAEFFALCRESLNPNIRTDAVDEMLVQHLLTERVFRTIFKEADFVRKNVIAQKVDGVISALVSQSFNRDEYLRPLDRFYKAVEVAAASIDDFQSKQHFLNSVYEKFFQGFSVKAADTHGIVYTPQPIVDFMCESVGAVLRDEFGVTLGSPGVNILDPCTGTGNFLVNLLRRVPKVDLPRVYREQLFANEVMLLPYYIASLNIERAYFDETGRYEAFDGLCFVDTLDLANPEQPRLELFNEQNAARVNRQKAASITVIVGNPPYNVGQLDENDNNKNRRYEVIDRRVRMTYARSSNATSVSKLNDPYVKFFRWAADRLGDRDGVVCFISNNSFVEQQAFDGMRKHLLEDYTTVYHLHLEGNVRQNPTLSGTQYNVFGIQVGVGVTVAVRSAAHERTRLYFHRIDKKLKRAAKLDWLKERRHIGGIEWDELTPDQRNTWLVPESADVFAKMMPIGSKEGKQARDEQAEVMFKEYTLGVATHRDAVVYGFSREDLVTRINDFAERYNAEVDRYRRADLKTGAESFAWDARVAWDRDLKQDAVRGTYATCDAGKVRRCVYRPFSPKWLYFDRLMNAEVYSLQSQYPTSDADNRAICLTGSGSEKPFMALVCSGIVDLHLAGAGAGTQCFSYYVYDDKGDERRENITDWALGRFQERYQDKAITKWDIFYYSYGLLHQPAYRERFAASMKRELPRIPFVTNFRAFRNAGQELADLHLNYEHLGPYPLKYVETPGVPLSFEVSDKMRLSKDKTSLRVNASLTLAGIPPEVSEYRLGSRSALEWVIDQHQVTTDKRTGVVSDPNRYDDPRYIVNLIGQVVKVSAETVKIVNALPADYGATIAANV